MRKNLKTIKYWGASTSAHQVEGGNHNQWSVWELGHAAELARNAEEKYAHWLPRWKDFSAEASMPENYVSGKSIDHYNRYEEDFDLLKDLKMNAFRFSIEWSRLEPEEGKWDNKEFEHYRSYIVQLKKRGIQPFLTLWHWTMPVWFTDRGGFEKRSNVKFFVRYAEKVVRELGDLLDYVIILNEPNVYTGMSYMDGLWPPQKQNKIRGLWVYQNLISAHNRSYRVIKETNPNLRLGTANQVAHVYIGKKGILSGFGAWSEKTFWNHWFIDRTEAKTDFVGLNYYFSDRWTGGFRPENSNERTNDLGFDMQPANIQYVVEDLYNRYKKPIIICENGLADKDDKDRKWWLEETLKAMEVAINNGVKIDGYLHWSLLDNFEWADGFWPRFGLIEVDYKTGERTIRNSAQWFSQQIREIQK